MAKLKLNVSDIAELVEQYNPFGFKDAKGHIMVFKTYEEAYLELIDRIFKAGPRMVDAVVFCIDNLGMKLVDAQRFVGLWKAVTGQDGAEFFFIWDSTEKADLAQPLERFARGMHLLSETKFNQDMFNAALYRAKLKYGKFKL